MNKIELYTNRLLRALIYYIDLDFFNEKYLKLLWERTVGLPASLNLEEPKSFNEKLQWLKLNDHNPLYTYLVDKIQAKEYVRKVLGDAFIIPTLGVWDNPADINYEQLPDKFVLKCNHDSGSIIMCDCKQLIDKKNINRLFRKRLKHNYYLQGREWAYKRVKPLIFAEEMIKPDNNTPLLDYKFMCFSGRVEYVFVVSDRFLEGTEIKVTFFDREWNLMPFERHYSKSDVTIEKPKNLSEMIDVAEKLSVGIPFVRVDLYNYEGKILFGEYTFYPGGGFEEFRPVEWDYKLGELIDLCLVK